MKFGQWKYYEAQVIILLFVLASKVIEVFGVGSSSSFMGLQGIHFDSASHDKGAVTLEPAIVMTTFLFPASPLCQRLLPW